MMPLPARPAWLCIDAPEHCRSGISEKEIPDLTPAQIAEAEAEDLRRNTICLIKANQVLEAKHQAKLARQENIRKAQRDRYAAWKEKQGIIRKSELAKEYAAILRHIREVREISRPELAKRLQCSTQSIANWECGRFAPRPNIQERILAMQ